MAGLPLLLVGLWKIPLAIRLPDFGCAAKLFYFVLRADDTAVEFPEIVKFAFFI